MATVPTIHDKPNNSVDFSAGKSMLIGRVTKVIMGQYTKDGKIDKDFGRFGGWGAVGSIRFNFFQTTAVGQDQTKTAAFAKPLFPNIKQYPLVGETVAIIEGPSPGLNERATARDYYYVSIYNLWNSQHHNAFPDLRDYEQQVSKPKTKTSTKSSATTKTTIPLGEYFVEYGNIKPLIPFEGDVIFEGRFGQSIRFSTTNPQQRDLNTWSKTGSFGDPITIFRNGQSADTGSGGWIPTVEDINRDGTTIIMSQKQAIEVKVNQYPLDTYRLGFKAEFNSDTTLPLRDLVPSIQNIASSDYDRRVFDKMKGIDETRQENPSTQDEVETIIE